jgi:hypothetical protein
VERFKYDIGARLVITVSGEECEVIGRAEYAKAENNYYVRYKAADGRAFEAWWSESALTPAAAE